MSRRSLIVPTLAAAALAGAAVAQEVEWQVVKPSNTGIPGEEVRFAKLGPDGRLWVAARWPFWREGGIGIYDFATGLWETWANWETPIPSEFVNDIEWAADGSVWIATSGGLVHKDGDEWTVYTRGNAPLKHNGIRNISIAPDGVVWINNSHVQQADHALFAFDGHDWEMHEVGGTLPWDEPWDELNAVLVASDGHVFATNSVLSGLAEYDGQSWTLHEPPNGDRFGPLLEDSQGDIWTYSGIGGLDLVTRFDRSSGTFGAFTPQQMGVSDTTPTLLTMDPQGRVYFGNWFGQVVRTADGGGSWQHFTDQQIRLHSIAFVGDDAYATSPGAVRHLDRSGAWLGAFNTYNTGMPDYFVDDLHRGRTSGEMLVATAEAGVSRFDGSRWENRGSHNPDAAWPALADGSDGAFEDAQGNIWIGTNGVIRWNPVEDDLELWDWRNTPIFGVTAFKYFAQSPGGEIWAATRYSSAYRFNGASWSGLGLDIYHNRGIERDGAGNMWLAEWFEINRWDGSAWSTWSGPHADYLFDLGGVTCIAIGPDDAVWLGTNDGLVRFDGSTWTLYDRSNSPMPAKQVQGVAFRDDGMMAFSVHTFQAQTPFPSGVVVVHVDDIDDPDAWRIFSHVNTPIPHWQLGDVEWDADGRLWVNAISEGAAVATFPDAGCAPDIDGDGDADVNDFFAYLDLFAAGDPRADVTGDGTVDVNDFFAYLDLFASGC